ncbi:unnamed protein product [Owenia fusiformis]|uniref:Uncharacterized protein n=1 Tax=Owenia fusiformis TaxID=6347 RepID=A0A8J1UYN2_OWEFU|nr:unnamed protein product [Owenia fusiformis]
MAVTMLYLLLVIYWIYGLNMVVAKETLRIGGIFPEEEDQLEGTMKFAIDTVNADPNLLPNYNIEYVANFTNLLGKFNTIMAVCDQLKQGITAIIGPLSSTSVKASHPMCGGFQTPMIAPSATDPTLVNVMEYEYLVRLSAPDSLQSQALVDLVKWFRWDTVAILSDNSDYGINGLVQFQTLASSNKWRVVSVQQFEAQDNASNVDATDQLRHIKETGCRVILLNTYTPMALSVLKQAHNMGMMGRGWLWIGTDGITTYGDTFENNFESNDFLEGFVGIRPTSFDGALYDDFKKRWQAANGTMYHGAGNNTSFTGSMLSFYDAVLVYASAMHTMLEEDGIRLSTKVSDCKQIPAVPWDQGKDLLKYLKQVDTDGVRMRLRFNGYGSPLHSKYEIVRFTNQGWEKFGSWDEENRLKLTPNITDITTLGGKPLLDIMDYRGDLNNKTLKVAVVVDPPFVFKEEPSTNISYTDSVACEGNSCFTGLAIDILKQIAEELQFNYVIHEASTYGSRNESTGKWTGMVSELIADNNGDTKSDLAVGAFTITYERQQVIAFSKPFLDFQMGILMGSLADPTYSPWSFLIPFTYELWGLILGTTVAVALTLSCIDKLSPYGHHGKKAQIAHEDEFEAMDKNEDGTIDHWEVLEWKREKRNFNIHNAIFWSFASLFEQGGEVHPKSWSGRVGATAWWFGALIIIATYTANLAAFLTIKASNVDVNSIEDLKASDLKYGTIDQHQVQTFFDTSVRDPYKQMGDNMRKWETYFDTTFDAVNHTQQNNGSFALLLDLPLLNYWKGQDCLLKVVSNGFGMAGYGFGLSKSSLYAEDLTVQIYAMRESGAIDNLIDKWVSKSATCSQADSGGIDEETVEVGMPSLWGVFWIIYVGFGISFLVLVLEWIIHISIHVDPTNKEKSKTFKEELQRRLSVLKDDFCHNWFPLSCKKVNTLKDEMNTALAEQNSLAHIDGVTPNGSHISISSRFSNRIHSMQSPDMNGNSSRNGHLRKYRITEC